MTEPLRTYLLEEVDPLRSMTIYQSPHAEDTIFLRREGGTITLGRKDAQALAHGLLAVLSGQFDRAATETYLRMEAEEIARRERVRQSAQIPDQRTREYIPPPNLENL